MGKGRPPGGTARGTLRLAAAAAALAIFVLLGPGAARTVAGNATAPALPSAGTLKFNLSGTDIDFSDPTLAYFKVSWQLEYSTALQLYNYPDEPAPDGGILTPEAAASMPEISADGKTYTITVESGFKFSDGSDVTAGNFAFAINRALQPVMASPAAAFIKHIVGAQDVLDGNATTASGVHVDGDQLIIELTHPDGALPAKLAMPFFQAIKTDMPTNPAGVSVYPSAGPYYWASRDAGQITIRRNPYYEGFRPANADEFDITVRTNVDQSLLQVKAGEADFDLGGLPPAAHADLGATYGVNRPGGQYHVTPMNELDYVALNTSRAPFSNANLRKAVNFAVDRPEMTFLRGAYAATPADQVLPPGMAGFRDEEIYPLDGPDYDTARSLAGSSCGTVKLWGLNTGSGPALAQAVKFSLEQIGCTVQLTLMSAVQLFTAAGQRGADFDAALVGWNQTYPDPSDFLELLDGNTIGDANNSNLAYFNDPDINTQLAQANELGGESRYAAYGDLDVEITADHAPWVAYDNRNAREFTAPRLRGYVFQPAVGSADLNTLTVNTPPVASDLSINVRKDQPTEITLEASDVDGDVLTFSILSDPAHGSLSALDNDFVVYTPSAGYTGPDSFTYKASDGQADSNVATVSITVRAPVISVTDLAHGTTATALASSLVGGGVTISNVSYTGAPGAAGAFSGGSAPIGFAQGLVLGSGSVQTTAEHNGVEGPNAEDNVTTANGQPGDADLNTLSGKSTSDAAVLEFDFVPQFSTVQFQYVFSSDEYNEYANSAFNDTFGFLVNGQNCAIVPGTASTPVGVNTINGGNPFGTNAQHPALFRNNDLDDEGGAINTEMDGLTVVLPCSAIVTPNVTNHLKLAIADAGDSSYDSNVFIEAGSLVSGTQIATSLTGGGQSGTAISVPAGTAVHDSATLSGQNVGSAGGTVSYKVYSDSNCQTLFASAGTKTVNNGSVPDSDPVTFNQGGTFHWQASYSGDALNQPGVSTCGGEVLTVTGNQAPVAQGGSAATAEDTPVGVNMSASDADGDALTYSIVAGPAHGALGSVTGNQVTYTPGPGFNGLDSFTFKANDGQLDSNVATVSITVTSADRPTLTVDVFGSGTVTSAPAGIDCPPSCSASFDAGDVTLTAHADVGEEFQSWSGCDQTVGPTCTLHMSFDRSVRAVFTSPGCLTYPGFSSAPKLAVLGDAAIVGGVLRLTPADFSQSGVAWHGSKVDVADGFVSDFDFRMTDMGGLGDGDGAGADGFTFAIQNTAVAATGSIGGGLGYDGLLNSLVVEFDTYDNGPGSGDPNGNHVSVHTRGPDANGPGEDSLLGVTALDPAVLKLNDGNVHRGRVTYNPSGGGRLSVYVDDLATPALTVTVSLSSTLTLDAGTAWVGFTAATGGGTENHDILDWFHCSGTQLPPALSLAPQAAVKKVGTQHTVTATFTDNGSPVAGAAVSFDVVSGPNAGTTGSATTQANGQAAFTYSSAATGTDDVRARAMRDGQTFVSNTATVDWETLRTLNVDLAGTGGGTVSITPDGEDAIDCSSDCSHDFPDGTHVTLTAAAADGSQFSGWSGACSGTDACALTLTADMNVTATFQHVNRAPVALGSSVTTDEGTAVAVPLQASDPDGDALTYTIVSAPAHGSLSGSGASRTFTPAAGYSGPDSFTFKVNDGSLDSNTATVSITVRHVNHAPVAQGASVTVQENASVSVTLAATDSDSDALSYTIVSAPAHGTLSGSGATRTYTPATGYSGADSFTFKAGDGALESNVATVLITITASTLKPPPTEKPEPQKTEVVKVLKGTVLVQRTRGGPFVPLTGTDTIPFGLVIDTTNGTLRLTVAKDRKGGSSSVDLTGGKFYAKQDATLLTTLALSGGNFNACGKRKLADTSPPKTGGTSVRHLWGSGKGRFRTKGRYGSATVRGTNWLTDDRCGGTLIYVKKGTVTVIDFVVHKTVIVKKGQSYLAKP
jgi:ABC-type transport system substrate-binding protein